ncbi:MAG TPA: FtsQ-type POTRA domain-containing protein [Humibacter sp.]|nr:FtsQ-type POTRA domain-containing protein [Humibacter sp.]
MIWLSSVTTVVAVLGVTVLAAFSPLMAVRTIDVMGTTRIDASAVRESLSSQLGKPLPLIDYGGIRRELDRYRLIRSYSTEAVPPGTLVVRIVERTPIGLIRSGNAYDLVDQAGVVISSTVQKPGGYPVITTSGRPGTSSAKQSFSASASVLAVLPSSLLPRVTAISASSADDVSFTLGGKKVVWGSTSDAELKATVLTALLKAAPRASVYDVSSPHAPVTR